MSHLRLVVSNVETESYTFRHNKYLVLDFGDIVDNTRDVIEQYCKDMLVQDAIEGHYITASKESIKFVTLTKIIPHTLTEAGGLLCFVEGVLEIQY